MTDEDLIATAKACQRAGAEGIHIHIRDADGKHLLDAQRYQSVLDRLEQVVPDMYLQVTSEAAGRYGTAEQQALVRTLKPRNVSVAMREMVRSEADWPTATEFYSWANQSDVAIQHILYSPAEAEQFLRAVENKQIPGDHFLLQFVLGTYDGTQKSDPADLRLFLDLLDRAPSQATFDWMLCAFGPEETRCLTEALRAGGKARVGFENSLWNADGSLAKDNAERVREVVAASSKP